MISFLVTYYNQENYVERSLNSILNQNLTEPFEILIGDDGSSDNTVNNIYKYMEKYKNSIKIFIQDRDNNIKYNAVERVSYNRLNLLKNAKGNFVCFLDGDDAYCDYDFIQESIDLLKSNTKIVGIAHKYQELFQDGTISSAKGITNYNCFSLKNYSKELYTHVGSIIFRNVFDIEDYSKLIALKSFDDNDITFYFLNFGKILCKDKIAYSYYQNAGSIWNTANDFEKCLINSIDYEIIKQISKKYHKRLLIKYGPALFYVFKNINEINNLKYEKYKAQVYEKGLINKCFHYKDTSLFIKIYIYSIILCMKINFHTFSFIFKIIDKIGG